MTQNVPDRRVWVVGLAVAALMTCQNPAEETGASAPEGPPEVEAAIVAGADLIGRIDLEGMRQATIVQQLRQTQDIEQLEKMAEANRRFKEATGLTQEDLLTAVFSANTSTLDTSQPQSTRLETLDAVMALALAKPLTLEQLVTGIQEATPEGPTPRVTEQTIAGRTALVVEPDTPQQNKAYLALSSTGSTVFLSLSEASLSAALTRADRGRLEIASSSLVTAESVLPVDAQFRMAFVVPDTLRSKLREAIQGGQESPQMAMLAGFLESFQDLQSLSLGVGLSQDMALDLACDLGSAESAQQAATLIDTMLAPMMKAALESAEQPATIAESFQVTPEGNALKIGLRLTAEDLDSIGNKAQDVAAGGR